MIKRCVFCIMLLAALIVFGVSSFAIDKPSGDRFYTVDENGFIVDDLEKVSEDSSMDELEQVVDSGVLPVEPPTSSVNYEMHLLVIIFMLAMLGGIVLCMIFFDRL